MGRCKNSVDNVLFDFFNDESGQATTEYILMLAVVVSLVSIVVKQLIGPTYQRLRVSVGRSIDNKLFPKGEGFHQFPLKAP